MGSKDYKRILLESLLKKYYKRVPDSSRRVIVKPEELYKKYAANNADIEEKYALHQAVESLLEKELIYVDYLKFSEDIEKIYFREENLDRLYDYLKTVYRIVPRPVLIQQMEELLEKYHQVGELTNAYRNQVRSMLQNPKTRWTPEQIEHVGANLKMLDFLEHNQKKLYVREASILLYGDSKWFEQNNMEEICNIIRNIRGIPKQEKEQNDTILVDYHVTPMDQEVLLKGNWEIEWDGYSIKTANLSGGIAISSGDVTTIKRVIVHSAEVMTVENKTSYYRIRRKNTAFVYLGGYANRYQIRFLQMTARDNPEILYRHFGDIDVGGFLIYKHLCRATEVPFQLYKMGIEELQNRQYQIGLRALTENDKNRMEHLEEDEEIGEVIRYMKENNVKLEQEIVSLMAGERIR